MNVKPNGNAIISLSSGEKKIGVFLHFLALAICLKALTSYFNMRATSSINTCQLPQL